MFFWKSSEVGKSLALCIRRDKEAAYAKLSS